MRNAIAAPLLAAALVSGLAVDAEARSRRSETAARAAPAAAAVPSAGPCLDAIRVAEREHTLPPGLLEAIGRTESGRTDPLTGRFAPWPWTINAEGQGQFFATKAEAIAAVQALQARGIRVIDVGCMQVNLFHHGEAFASLDHAFDPATNARYAATFLRRLNQTRNDWELAAAHYHSTTPERADAYRLKVLANWPQMAGRYAEERQRQAMVTAWGGTATPLTITRPNGFQVRALALTQRPMLHGRDSALLDPIPPLRVVSRSATGRPVYRVELAEAGPARPTTRR
jgi:hypothetical protein